LLYLFNSIAGLSVISLTLTYLMQIYSQLQQRNAFALKIYLATRSTGDAAELVTGIMPHGDWNLGTSFLWEMAAETALTKEAHHFYPVLFYMRFPEHYYSVSFVTLVLLDSVTLMRSALSDEYASLKKLRALDQLWEGSLPSPHLARRNISAARSGRSRGTRCGRNVALGMATGQSPRPVKIRGDCDGRSSGLPQSLHRIAQSMGWSRAQAGAFHAVPDA
jgi:hypothetical protein